MNRTQHTLKNLYFAALSQMISTLMAFLCRTVFIHTLGKTYLGFSGLFADILMIFSLAELGIGSVLTYEMYGPAAKHDAQALARLLAVYRRLYRYVGAVVAAAGVGMIPFLHYVITDIPDIPHLYTVYLLYVSNTVIGYFFSYTSGLLTACQEQYVGMAVTAAVSIVLKSAQMILLLVGGDFIGYLFLMNLCTLAGNFALYRLVKRKYPDVFASLNEVDRIGGGGLQEADFRAKVRRNIRARFVSRLSSAAVTYTDNLMISAFVSTTILGLYSNYTMVAGVVRSVLGSVTGAVTGSVGQMIAVEPGERVYRMFRNIWFLNFWLTAVLSGGFFVMITPFIRLWAGPSYLLDGRILAVFCLNLYVRQMRNPLLIFHDAYGHFVEMKRKNIGEALLNILLSLLFVRILPWGSTGILLGTLCSDLLTNFWFEPYLLCRRMGVSVWKYMARYAGYMLTWLTGTTLSGFVCRRIFSVSLFHGVHPWAAFVLSGLACAFVLNGVIVLFWHRSGEFGYVLLLMRDILKKLRSRADRA